MKMARSALCKRVRRAFTLIEVLIAVLVLSLGLLGLAAVFPAVIAQQRNAVDRTQGAVVAKVVEQTLRSSQFLVDFKGLRRDFWFSADASLGCGAGFDLDTQDMSFLWEPTWEWGPAGHMGMLLAGDEYVNSGAIRVGRGEMLDLSCATSQPAEQFYIPASARVFPQPYSGEEPRYVWDFVARRVRLSSASSGIEVAVFIRRVDPRIRVPRDRTLSDVLTGNRVTASQVRLPVAADANGLPTGDGVGAYAVPMTVPVIVRSTAPDRLVLDPSASAQMRDLWKRVIASPGQILVDNLGNVLNVVEVPESQTGDPVEIVVDRRYAQDLTDFNFGVDPRGTKVEQILFTAQKPVRVFTFRPEW